MSVAAPRAWRSVARHETADELLDKVTVACPNDAAKSVPSAPKLELSHKPAGDWKVAEASAKIAAQAIAPAGDSPQPQPIPLSLDLVLNSTQSPPLAMIPDSSKLPLDPPIKTSLDLPKELPDPSGPQNKSSKADVLPEKQTKTPAAADAEKKPEKTADIKEQESAEKKLQPDWPMPLALYKQLDELAKNATTRQWAEEVRRLLDDLGPALALQSSRENAEASSIFARLRALNDNADSVTDRMEDDCLAEQFRRTSSSLRRRLDLWQLLADIDTPNQSNDASYEDANRLAMVLTKVELLVGKSDRGAAWRDFLLIDALRSLADEDKTVAADTAEENGQEDWAEKARRRMLAGEVLARVARCKLSEDQQQFLTRDPFMQLGTELRRITDGAFDRRELVRRLEEYEAKNLPGESRWLADESLRLAVSEDPQKKALGQQLAHHYCNPNLRIALTEDFLNRLMPRQTAELASVRDTVLGTPVRGQSLTETDVTIRLIPDPHRLLLALEISGDVASLTNSSSGPATFRTESTSRYVARKPMEITTTGISLWPAEVTEVRNAMRLRGLSTDYDGIPLIGAIVQNMARSSHDAKREEVKREIKRKVATKAKQRIDDEADERLNQTSQRLKERVLQPLENLAIVPEMIAAETDEQRLVMQLRLASDQQLAAHTQRPWAPMDSLMSFQIHQTAVNNVLGGLSLDGDTLTLKELRERIATKFNTPSLLDEENKHDDVKITFASRDSVRIDCHNGRIAVTLSIARLESEQQVWEYFQVRAYYRIEIDGLSATLVRDGSIRMVGRRVSTASQFAIRSIFGRVFSKSASQQLVPERILNNPNMADQVVTQFEIEDGWIAMAMGPRR